MINSLFPRYWPRYVAGPYRMLVQDFANWIIFSGYTRTCAKGHIRRLHEVLTSKGVKICPGEPISSVVLTHCFAPWENNSYYCATHTLTKRFLVDHHLLRLRVKTKPFEALTTMYRLHLVDQRGLSPSTVKQHLQTIEYFLKSACSRSHSIARLSPIDIEHFVGRLSKHLKRQSLQHTIAHLRSFLRFCFNHGITKQRLEMIDTPRTYRGELPPRALPWNLVRKLLKSIDRSSIDGCRDYAILYLMAYYGLRPSEIAALTVDSINWDDRTLRIEHCKTRSLVTFPFDDRTARIISSYLRCRSDATRREIFLRVRCPSGPIKAATIGDIYDNRARRSGLPIVGSSAYSLRHSFAMRLLNRGVGIKTIGDLLGHHSFESTCIYLRLHTRALRDVGLPLPHHG